MSINPLFLSAAAMAATAEAPAADPSTAIEAADVTVRENELVMELDAGIVNASFDFNPSSFQVSDGQPQGEPPVVVTFLRSKQELDFRVFAGRRRTGSVADTFNGRTTARVATRRGSDEGEPDQLNFTFSGTLTLNGDQFPNFNIGQGSRSGNNNWWVGVASGGETSAGGGNAFLCLTGPTGTVYQITLPGNDSFHLGVRVLGEGEPCGS